MERVALLDWIECDCGGRAPLEFREVALANGVKVSNVPQYYCEKCGEVNRSLRVGEALEALESYEVP